MHIVANCEPAAFLTINVAFYDPVLQPPPFSLWQNYLLQISSDRKEDTKLSCNFQVLKVTMQITVTLQSIGKTNKFDWGIRGFQVKYAPGFTPRKLHDSFCSMSILSTLNCLFFEVRWLQAAARGKKTRLMTVMLDTKPLIVKMYYKTSKAFLFNFSIAF